MAVGNGKQGPFPGSCGPERAEVESKVSLIGRRSQKQMAFGWLPGLQVVMAAVAVMVGLSAFAAVAWAAEDAGSAPSARPGWALVIHGGAGTIVPDAMSEEDEAAYRRKLREVLDLGAAMLEDGRSSLDAVEAVIRAMEDCPLFNAGKGAVFTAAGTNEMDASIMDGRTLDAGAVAGVKTVKHPISAARAVMGHSPHVMLAGEGADSFAAEQGLEIVPPDYFWTERRWKDYLRRKEESEKESREEGSGSNDEHGTVGCVALDRNGDIAAGTSTGGMTMKMWGRIGDSPIIGAGTYADNASCGVSCTGHGEYFIRNAVAYDITALMKYRGLRLEEATRSVVLGKLKDQGAAGGVIALDREGHVSMVFNTAGMFRGFITADGTAQVFLFGENEGESAGN